MILAASFADAGSATEFDAPQLVAPDEGAVVSLTIPHLDWRPIFAAKAAAMPDYLVQISRDPQFVAIEDEDRIAAVITRYVPDRELPPGDYWWRVAGINAAGWRGGWSQSRKFSMRPPAKVIAVPLGSTHREIKARFAEALAAAPATLRFEPGEYRVEQESAAFFEFGAARDVTIDGRGARVVITRRPSPSWFARFDGSRNIHVKDLELDYDPVSHSAARVLTIDRTRGTADVEVLPGFPLYEELDHAGLRDKAQLGAGALLRDAKTFGPKEGAPVLTPAAIKQSLGGRRYRIAPAPPAHLDSFAPGDIFVRGAGRSGNAFQIGHSHDIVLSGITLFAAPGIGFQSDHSDRLRIIRCRIARREGRFLSAPNGGHNHHNARVGPWVEGCVFEAVGDDTLHVNATVIYLGAKLAPNRILLQSAHVQRGDRLQFWDPVAARLLSERHVLAVHPSGDGVEVTLDDDAGAIHPSRRTGAKSTTGTHVYNADAMCNQFVWRNNVARDGLRNGLVLKGAGGLVERNQFEGLGVSGILFSNTPFEGLAARDYVVRDNRIVNCGLLAPRNAPASIQAQFLGAPRGTIRHDNLLIANNTIADCPLAPIGIRSATGLIITGNHFESTRRAAFRRPVESVVQLHGVDGALIANNIVADTRLAGVPLLAINDSTRVETEAPRSFTPTVDSDVPPKTTP